jgi:phosphatidylinositol alpha 1,6-mannosyltransferase
LDNSKKRVNLGFVGRIHQERDPLLWTEIANSLPDTPKLVVGDGPLLSEMQRKLKGGEFTGAVDSARLGEIWPRIKVLLSTAPHESYGLTLREALLHEVPVVAKKSAGARELSSKFPNLVKLFVTPAEATAHLITLQKSPPSRDDFKSFREWFVQEQNESLLALAKLWAQA